MVSVEGAGTLEERPAHGGEVAERRAAERIETVGRLDVPAREAVDELLRAAKAADGVSPVGEHKYLKLHSGVNSVRALLAWDGDRLVGYGQILRSGSEATAEIVVHPEARRRGLGSRLIARARELASADADELNIWAYGALAPGAAIAARCGLTTARTLLQLERPLDTLPPMPDLAGYTIRQFDAAADAAAWLELHNRVFADHPENGTWSPADLEARLHQPWFSAEDFLVAEAGGRMVGFNWLKQVPAAPPDLPEGEIYIIGVDDSQRGRGLGRALAVLGLHHLRRRGMRVCTLYVEDDNAPALRLYRALGFVVRHAHRCYRLPLAVSHAAVTAEGATRDGVADGGAATPGANPALASCP